MTTMTTLANHPLRSRESFRTPQPPNQLFQGLAVALPICLAGWAVVVACVLWIVL